MVTTSTAGVSVSTRLFCAGYAVITVAALVATWSQNVAYVDNPAGRSA